MNGPEVICLDGTSHDVGSAPHRQRQRQRNRQPKPSNSKRNDDNVICLLDSSDDESSVEDVLVVEPPKSKKATSIKNSDTSLKQPPSNPAASTKTKQPPANSDGNSASAKKDDDVTNDRKPKALSRKELFRRQRLLAANQAASTPSDKKPTSTDNKGKKVVNPYLKKQSPPCSQEPVTSEPSSVQFTSRTSSIHSTGSAQKGLEETPISNPYKKTPASSAAKASPSAASPGVFYPQLRANHRMHGDIRPNLVLALWKFSRQHLTRESYNLTRLDKYISRLVDLAVVNRDFPIRTLGEYAFRPRSPGIHGAGGMDLDRYKRFKEDIKSTAMLSMSIPVDACSASRQYFTIAEACLVAMREEIVARWRRKQQQQQQQHGDGSPPRFPGDQEAQTMILSQKDYWVSLAELIPKIDARLRPECPGKLKRDKDVDNGAAHYLENSTRSAEFKQIEKLISKQASVENGVTTGPDMGFLKNHSVKKQRYYELTSLGYKTAELIRTRPFPAAVGHYRCSNLETVNPEYDGICLAVDMREGGGQFGKKTLHEMCNTLDKVSIPYFVGNLDIGDYCFFSRNLLCPILVERKSVQDLAQSIHDGRMDRQKQNMYRGQFTFGYDNSRIAMIVEGKVEKQQVTGGYIGSARFGVTKEQFEKEMETMKEEGFDVILTTRAENSMLELARWAKRVAKEVQAGSLTLEYTYNDFIDQVNKIPASTDFSRLAKYHANEKKQAAADRSRNETTIDLVDSDDEDGGTVLSQQQELQPSNLDAEFARAKRPLQPRNNTQPASTKRSRVEDKKVGGNEYEDMSAAQLRAKCVEYGLPKSGKKEELINRLLKPRPPEIYCIRKRRGLYVPARLDTSGTALLVAIQILQDQAPSVQNYVGHTKDEIYVLAEALDIKKDPFSGGTTQTGPYHYDGWSCMSSLLEPGDPPLVIKKKVNRKDVFRLSTSSDVSGLALARAMHKWCHESNICRCEEMGHEYNL